MPKRTCSIDDCGKPHRARGMCSTHYNATYDTDRHRKMRKVACSWCGRPIMKAATNGSRRPVCSDLCRASLQLGRQLPPRPSKTIVGPLPWSDPLPKVRPATPDMPSSMKRVFVNGQCDWCGGEFTTACPAGGAMAKRCSKRCASKAANAARGGRFKISPVRRRRLYERDGWTCQLCLEPVDPNADPHGDWGPSLDHIVPQSWQIIPDHSDANLRLAHRWCNLVRGNETYYTAADLVA